MFYVMHCVPETLLIHTLSIYSYPTQLSLPLPLPPPPTPSHSSLNFTSYPLCLLSLPTSLTHLIPSFSSPVEIAQGCEPSKRFGHSAILVGPGPGQGSAFNTTEQVNIFYAENHSKRNACRYFCRRKNDFYAEFSLI